MEGRNEKVTHHKIPAPEKRSTHIHKFYPKFDSTVNKPASSVLNAKP